MNFASIFLDFVYIAAAFGLLAVVATVIALCNAPKGIEGEDGFHAIEQQDSTSADPKAIPAYSQSMKV